MWWLEPARLVLVAGMFIYTGYRDLKDREVEDRPWIVLAAAGLVLLAIDMAYSFSWDHLLLVLLSIGISAGIGWGLYYFQFYGGADAKALTTLAFLLPLYQARFSWHLFAPIVVLGNGLLLTMSLPLALLTYNLSRLLKGEEIFEGFEAEPAHRKLLACLLGYRAKRSRPEQFLFALEERVGDAKRFRFLVGRLDEEFVEGEEIWVTPGIPLLIYIGAGFGAMLLVGDLFGLIIRSLVALFTV
jgi:preflagellin peptidase FlaK